MKPSKKSAGTLKVIIGWEEFGSLAEDLANRIKKDGVHFDLVVGVARGGVPLSMVVADRLLLPVDFINVKSYVEQGKRSEVRILSTLTSDAKNKDVLLVDDLVDEGETISKLMEYLRERYSPVRLRTAVLYKKPWSRIIPDYFMGTTDAWVIFPWEHGEFLKGE